VADDADEVRAVACGPFHGGVGVGLAPPHLHPVTPLPLLGRPDPSTWELGLGCGRGGLAGVVRMLVTLRVIY
jgi:hypothetical protein